MSALLEEALRRLESSPVEVQEVLASQIIESLDDEAAWTERFAKLSKRMVELSEVTISEHRNGETRSIDELIA